MRFADRTTTPDCRLPDCRLLGYLQQCGFTRQWAILVWLVWVMLLLLLLIVLWLPYRVFELICAAFIQATAVPGFNTRPDDVQHPYGE
jgi:hypothetical protein